MLPKLKNNVFTTGEIFSILEHRIFILGACSRNKNQFFLNRSRFLISGVDIFHFGSMLSKMKYFFQFQKNFPFQEQLYRFGGMNLISIYLSIYLSICLSVCLSVCLSIYLPIFTLYVCIYNTSLDFRFRTNNVNKVNL